MPANDLLPRSITPLLQHAGRTFPAVSITGPRQSGKSSLATKAFPSHRVAIMESPDVLDAVKRDARAFLRSFDDAPGAILDEVQRAPELLSYLLEEIDRDLRTGRGMGRWILTGSESLLLSHRISQSLAGRVAVFELLPMSHGELRGFPRRRGDARATLGRAVLLGGYPPIHARRPHPTSWFASYVASYLERDVRSIVQIGELSLFQRFLTMCAGRTAQLLNLSALAADIGVSQPTARAWMSVLEATYIVKLVPGWFGNISKRLVKAPKLHFVDTGLACALLGISDEKVLDTHPLRGPLVESWFAGELLKAQAAHGLRSRIFHWRDQNAAEADLGVDLGGKLTVIEVKSAMTVHQDWARSLERMTSALPAGTPVERVIVHGGGEDMPPLKGTTLVPWSRAAEFATRVFAEGAGNPPGVKPATKPVKATLAAKTSSPAKPVSNAKQSAPPKKAGRGAKVAKSAKVTRSTKAAKSAKKPRRA
jgi:predicted AAA+ superfamily ATPase